MGNVGEGLLKKREKKRDERNAFKTQPQNTFTNYQCACHLHNYNIVKRQRPIQQLNRIGIKSYSTEIYCVNNLLNNWGPLADETSAKFDLVLSLIRVHCITLFCSNVHVSSMLYLFSNAIDLSRSR